MVEIGTGRQPAWKLTAHSEHQPRELTVPHYRVPRKKERVTRSVISTFGSENEMHWMWSSAGETSYRIRQRKLGIPMRDCRDGRENP